MYTIGCEISKFGLLKTKIKFDRSVKKSIIPVKGDIMEHEEKTLLKSMSRREAKVMKALLEKNGAVTYWDLYEKVYGEEKTKNATERKMNQDVRAAIHHIRIRLKMLNVDKMYKIDTLLGSGYILRKQ